MRVRRNIWGGIFAAIVVFTGAIAADILLNKAASLSATYHHFQIGTVVPAEILFCAVLSLPVIAVVSGIQFLRFFIKSRKQRKSVEMTATS
jgi:hypothetical protein